MAIEVKAESLKIDREHAETVASKLNALLDEFAAGGYKQGCRNNMAVDLSILCFELDIDPMETAEYAWKHTAARQTYDLKDRIDVIENYLKDWDAYGIEQYMLMDDSWVDPKEEWVVLV